MTKLVRSGSKPKSQRAPKPRPRSWALQDAKASFSEVVRRAREDGPQHVTVHGKDAVVIVSAEEFGRLAGRAKHPTLRSLLASSPLNDLELDLERPRVVVRPVDL
jgi:prevent-host-death family protein